MYCQGATCDNGVAEPNDVLCIARVLLVNNGVAEPNDVICIARVLL